MTTNLNIFKKDINLKNVTNFFSLAIFIILTANFYLKYLPREVNSVLEISLLIILTSENSSSILKSFYKTSKGYLIDNFIPRFFLIFSPVAGYFFYKVYLTYFSVVVLLLAIYILVIVPIFISNAWFEYTINLPPSQQSFWRKICKISGNNILEMDAKFKDGGINKFGLYYTPGVVFSIYCLFIGLISHLLSTNSLFFSLLFIIWLLSNILVKKIPLKNIENQLVHSATWFVFSPKSISGYFIIILGLGGSLCFISPVLLSNLSFYIVPPYLFQFFFWIMILKRYPYFLQAWKTHRLIRGPPLPAGHIYTFAGTYISIFCIYIINSMYLFAPQLIRKILSINIYTSWNIINLVILAIMFYSLLNLISGKKDENLLRDNLRIPLAISIQILSFAIACHWINSYFWNNKLNSFDFLLGSIGLTLMLIIAFYSDDIYKTGKKASKIIFLIIFVTIQPYPLNH